MGHRYRHLSIEERCEIARLSTAGQSIRQIAAALDRAPSSIARELHRNTSQQSGYQPRYADDMSRARRWTGSKLDRDAHLRDEVLVRLGAGWSPAQIAGRLRRDLGECIVSHETIYRFLYAQIARTKDYTWRLLLPRAKWKRGRRRRKGGSTARTIAQRRPISNRPVEANDRQHPGHWEADLILFARYGQALLAVHERQSRLLLVVRPDSKHASTIADLMRAMLEPFPEHWRRTITFDNGSEFARHYNLHHLGLDTFFCDTHSPWQKGGIENAIGRMRRVLPRKTDLATLSQDDLVLLIRRYNNTPRKCLDFQTPAEFFWEHVLHFKCESIFPLSRE